MHNYFHRYVSHGQKVSPYLPSNFIPLFDGHDRKWFNLKESENETEIFIYDEISWWGITADDLVSTIVGIEADNITVRINSPGGSVFDGLAITNALRTHPANITTVNDSLAASIASIIMMAGDQRKAQNNSMMMIHNAWGIAIGDHHEMSKTAALLEKITGTLADEYARYSNEDASYFLNAMDNEAWLSAQESSDLGLVTEVLNAESEGITDSADKAIVQNTLRQQKLNLFERLLA